MPYPLLPRSGACIQARVRSHALSTALCAIRSFDTRGYRVPGLRALAMADRPTCCAPGEDAEALVCLPPLGRRPQCVGLRTPRHRQACGKVSICRQRTVLGTMCKSWCPAERDQAFRACTGLRVTHSAQERITVLHTEISSICPDRTQALHRLTCPVRSHVCHITYVILCNRRLNA